MPFAHCPWGPNRHRPSGGLVLVLAGLAIVATVPPGGAQAQPALAGIVLPIPPGKIAEVDATINELVEKALNKLDKERGEGPRPAFRLICDFNPDNLPNKTDSFGSCSDLADKLRQLQEKHGITITAYVHGEVSGHCVLPVLACAPLMVMSRNAQLGPVVEASKTLDPDKRATYDRIARTRYPLVLVHKMYDRDLVVVRVIDGRGLDRFRDASEKPAPRGQPVANLGRNITASYNFDQARDYGFCQEDARDDVKDVLDAFGLPHAALSQIPDKPVVWEMVLTGPINAAMREKVQRHVRRALGQKANVLIFRLECGAGDSQQAQELALELTRINEKRLTNPVETIAYVTPQARDTATFLALACDKIVMHPDARLGDFDRYMLEQPSMEGAVADNLAGVAAKKRYSPVLARGMLDRGMRIHLVVRVGGSETTFLDEATFNKENKDSEEKTGKRRWTSLEVVKDGSNRYLTLNAVTARKLGVAYAVVDKVDAIYEMAGVGPGDVRMADGDMLDDVAEFLRNPWTRLILIMVGITCLILELKVPGVTLPGVIAAVCFVLFFWAHSQLHGQMTILALMLFLLGLVMLAIEIFVLPGLGVCGVTGMILVVGSLGLVAYGHWPRNTEDWMGYGRTLGPMGLSILGAICMAFLLARYLHSIPFINRLLLKPHTDETDESSDDSNPLATPPEMAALLGAIGVAATPLRPAGKTQFGDAFVDVVAEGSYVQPGARVQVIEIEGNRVVVKEV